MAATLNVCIVGPVKILLIEDDSQTADYISKGLREHGHVVDKTDNGRDGLYMATGKQHLDNRTLIDHKSPRCTSRVPSGGMSFSLHTSFHCPDIASSCSFMWFN